MLLLNYVEGIPVSLIKTYLHQQQALEESKLDLLEYVMFGGLSPVKELESIYDKLHSNKETTSRKKAETYGD